MNKLITLALGLLFLCNPAFAQFTDAQKQFLSNENLLVNPGCESGKTGWTVTAGTFTRDTSVKVRGSASCKVVLSAQTLAVTQDVTTNAAQYNGTVQGLEYVRVKSDVALNLCARQAGVTSTSLCVSILPTNTWGLYKIPFVLGGTSNGISITSSGAVTGTVQWDDSFLGPVDLKADAPSINSQSILLRQSVSFGNVVITGALTSNTGDTTIISYNSSTGVYTVNRKANINVSATFDGGGAILVPTILKGGLNMGYDYGPSGDASATFLANAGDTFTVNNSSAGPTTNQIITVLATEVSNSSTYSTSNLDSSKVGQIIYSASSSAPNGFISANGTTIGAGSSSATAKGQDYYTLYSILWAMNGLSTTAGDPFVISSAKGTDALSDWNANKTINIDFATNEVFIRSKSSSRTLGSFQDSANLTHSHTARISNNAGGNSDSFVATNAGSGGNNVTSTGSGVINTSATGSTESRPKNVSLIPYIRYQPESSIIVASLSGLQSCTDTKSCTDTFSAKVSASLTVSDENVDWINGNATLSDSSLFTVTFNTGMFSATPNCVVTPIDSLDVTVFNITSVSSTSIAVRTGYYGGTGLALTKGGYNFNIFCQKTGVDYVGKTAFAVASDQNVRTPGILKSVLFSAKVSAAGVISNNKGGIVSTASCSGGSWTINFGTTLASAPNCSIDFTTGSSFRFAPTAVSTNTGGLTFLTAVANQTYNCADDVSIVCHGETP